MKSLVRLAKEWLGMKRELTVAPDVEARFILVLGSLPVGTLTVKDGVWQFKYADEFKRESDLRPLVEFPDLDQTYEQRELWQFFASRIPSTLQPDVELVMEKEKIEEDDLIALLKRFGKRTITSPFELKDEDDLMVAMR
jgi:HipA-like protein